MKDKFFSKLDWAAFWTATIVTFAVYFYTLGPSVGLEDSGELATAAANLGVPHPPGYPFWTFCSWLFCKLFGWVTYMGHPTPAWCVSLCSATFGAFAAGCTAMLICRSARDFAGQKSFSKLRAAIAGLYNKQGRYRESAQAFREAVMLYPASPEATFRYAQETLMPFRRWDVALELMDYTDKIDPNNKRTAGLRNYVSRIKTLTAEVTHLEGLRREKKLTPQDVFALSRCYYEMGRVPEAAQLLRGISESLTDQGALQFAATIFMDAHQDADAESALNRYLKLNPQGDANAWADLAKLQHRTGRREAAACRRTRSSTRSPPRSSSAGSEACGI